jgi:putative phosphonate metabolism protein
MVSFPRYSIYYAASHGTLLDQFGAKLLGYDAWTGEDLPFPEKVLEAVPDWAELTQEPRKYGFHATLKAPFSLAQGKTEADLLAACANFADTPRPIPTIRPVVNLISGFTAVIPAEPSVEVERLASDCVRAFDCFRAPLTAEDRARRNPQKLNARQIEYLDRWGYPYVMEEFRFHMTLTGRLVSARREAVLAFLRERFSKIGLAELAIDGIALFRQTMASSRFQIVGHWPLRVPRR